MDYGTDLMGSIQKIKGDIHGQNAQEVKGDQLYFENVDTVNINNKETVPLSLIEYILTYVIIYTIVGLLFLIGMTIYSAKIMNVGSIINPMWDIVFVGFGLFVTLSVAVLHWFIKTTTCRDCTYLVLPRLKSKVALGN